ncbi:hypothetical protein P4V64_10110 [Bacillus thuringiensis]|nr:hypothetical protein [Bacillus thuringiensis]
MGYDTKNVLRDKGRIPVPQYFEVNRDDYQIVHGRKGATFVQPFGLAAKEPFSGSEDTDHVFSEPMYGFVIKNDGQTDLTFTIHNYTFTVKAEESFEAFFDAFTQVKIATTSSFRAYGRG